MTLPIGRDERISMLQQALSGLARRQQAIASNIANIDTPGYQRRDVPFESELRASMAGDSGARMMATSGGHMSLAPSGNSLLRGAMGESERGGTSPRNDGNNVDMDYEMTQLAETSLRYQLLTQATSTRFMTLRDLVSRIT